MAAASRLSLEAQLTLALVRAAPPPAETLGGLAREADGERLAALAIREGVAPLLHARLSATPAYEALVGEHARAAWAGEAAVTWGRSTVFRAAWRDAVETLARARVPTLTLKGLALVERGAYDPGTRPMADIDLLVHAHAVGPATEALARAGWRVLDLGDIAEPAAVHLRRGDVVIDLHREIADYPRVRHVLRVDHDALWARSRALGAAPEIRVPADEDMVLHLALHLVLGAEFGRLLNYVDLDATVRRAGDALDWDRLFGEARRWGIASVVAYSLGIASAALGTPVPQLPCPSPLRARLLARCVPREVPPSLAGPRSDVAVYAGETLLLDTWPAIARVALWTLFPSAGWLRRHYHARSPLALGLARAVHPVRMGWRVARGAR